MSFCLKFFYFTFIFKFNQPYLVTVKEKLNFILLRSVKFHKLHTCGIHENSIEKQAEKFYTNPN